MLVATLSMGAKYGYLHFTGSDDSITVVETDGLELTFDGTNIVATNSSGEKLTLTADELASMKFSEMKPTGINDILSDDVDAPVEAYSLGGIKAGRFVTVSHALASLPAGIYVLLTEKGKTIKVLVGK